jgi:hypothetical protein
MAKRTADDSAEGTDDTSRLDSEQDGAVIEGASGSDEGVSVPVVIPGEIVAAEPEPEPVKRGRGRPRSRSTSSGSSKPQKQTTQDLTGILMSCHVMLAAITKTPELELTEEESKRIGAAVARVNEEFGGVVVSPKTAALINLAMAAGSVYGPRFVAINVRKRTERSTKHPQPIPTATMNGPFAVAAAAPAKGVN